MFFLSGYLTNAVEIFVVHNDCSLSFVWLYIASELYSWVYLNEWMNEWVITVTEERMQILTFHWIPRNVFLSVCAKGYQVAEHRISQT